MFVIKTPKTFTLNYKDSVITFNVRRISNTKKINLKPYIKTFSGSITAPHYISFSQIQNFAYKNIEWLYTILNKNKPISIIHLHNLSLFGKQISIKIENITNKTTSIILSKKKLTIKLNPNNMDNSLNKIKKFFQNLAKKYIIYNANYYSACMGVKYNEITMKDNKTRWGSCSLRKNISINWRLIFAPKEVLDYVIIHEIAHLVHFNHSKSFWNLVEKFQPNFKKNKIWLKQLGYTVHNVNF